MVSKLGRLGYLSAAPRVSTCQNAEASGPSAHVTGVIQAFESLGFSVAQFIVGDRVPSGWRGKGSEKAISSNLLQTVLADLFRLALGFINARRAWKELGADVDWVYERFASLQSLGWIFQKNGIPWVLETNGPFFYEAKFDRSSIALSELARKIELRAYRQCDVLICVTQALKDIVVRESGVAPEKVLVIPNGVDIRLFDPELYPATQSSNQLTIGFAGTLTNWQGLGLLLQAMRNARNIGIDLALLIIGDGQMYREWLSLANELGLENRVRFMGRVSRQEVPRYLASVDIGFSGQVESAEVGKMYHSPLKIYEYMAMAKPVIASKFEDAIRIVEEGKTGFLFTPGNVEALTNTLVMVHGARDRLADMGKQARAEIIVNHSWQCRVRDIIRQSNRLIREK